VVLSNLKKTLILLIIHMCYRPIGIWCAVHICILYIYIYIYIYIYTQCVSRLVDITEGGVFLGLCDQKISYKYVSDFGRLRIYGHLLIPYKPSCERRYGTSCAVMYWTWCLIVCVARIIFATWLAHPAADVVYVYVFVTVIQFRP